MVLNGAGAVPKYKMVEGQEARLQRFISILVPANTYQDLGPACHVGGGAMSVVPMGWISSVSLMQTVVRQLVLVESGIHVSRDSSEISKMKPFPTDPSSSLLYLDSYDEDRCGLPGRAGRSGVRKAWKICSSLQKIWLPLVTQYWKTPHGGSERQPARRDVG